MPLGWIALLWLTAGEPSSAPPPEIAAVELSFSTHAGEGAGGSKRLLRDGCYVLETVGGTGGGLARDSQAGCHRRSDVAESFKRLEVLASGGAVVRESAAPVSEGNRGRVGGLVESHVVLVRADGTRWVARNEGVARRLEGALEEMPSHDQWYAKPPEPPAGKGPQLVALNVAAPGRDGLRRLQASLAADGRWWCYRSVGTLSTEAPKLAAKRPSPISEADARARLGRILQEARSSGATDEEAPKRESGGGETSIEVAFPGQARGALVPARLARTVVDRFAAEMRRQSPACAAP